MDAVILKQMGDLVEKFDEVKTEMHGLRSDISDLASALRGNPALGSTGLVHRIEEEEQASREMKKEVDALKQEVLGQRLYIARVQKILFWVLGVLVAGGSFTGAISGFFKSLLGGG